MGNYVGIDYGMGRTNINTETGIRYGVISTNHESLTEWFWESTEPEYGEPTCPECGKEFDREVLRGGSQVKAPCGHSFGDWECWPDEPIGHTLTEEGYEGFADSDNDLWVTKSPYYTHATFCSPCAPGAGDLGSPNPDGPKVYCLGHEWFRNEVAPYPVYSVETGKEVAPSVEAPHN